MAKTPLWYSHLSSGLYHLENSGCMRFDGVREISLESNNVGRQTRMAEVCQSLTKAFE
jgi:hypothetical protein